MKELLIVMLIFIILFFIIFNIAPFIYADTFGHYLVPIHYIYVYGEVTPMKITLRTQQRFETKKEKCNPWLMWWQNATGLQLVKMKPLETYYIYQDERIERLWKQVTCDVRGIPASISISIIKSRSIENEN